MTCNEAYYSLDEPKVGIRNEWLNEYSPKIFGRTFCRYHYHLYSNHWAMSFIFTESRKRLFLDCMNLLPLQWQIRQPMKSLFARLCVLLKDIFFIIEEFTYLERTLLFLHHFIWEHHLVIKWFILNWAIWSHWTYSDQFEPFKTIWFEPFALQRENFYIPVIFSDLVWNTYQSCLMVK